MFSFGYNNYFFNCLIFLTMKLTLLLLIFAFLINFVPCSYGQSISQWRGANRDGIYPDQNLLKVWPEAGPKLLWLTEELGNGYSSPVIADGKLYINGEIDSISHVFAFDQNGKLLWKTPNGREFFGEGYSASFPGARSAPTIYNDLIYVTSGLGRIACLNATSGKEKWAVDMVKDLGGKLNYFGYSESLLVDDKLVYCYPGGDETNFVALDKLTGKMVWKSKAMGDPVAFCSPMMIRLPDRNVLATVSHNYLLGLDARNGELLWSFHEDSVKLEGDYCNTPIYSDGFIYNVSGIEKGTGAYKLQLSPDGKSINEIWRNSRVKNAMGGMVKIGDHLFCTSDDKKLKCLDLRSGIVVDSLSNMRGTLISADDHLYCYSDNGRVNLIKISVSKMEVVSQFKIDKGTKEHFSHPVIANGVLYVRHGNALMAYQIK
jgi:outer membrane protein assembly factor BamB